MANPLRVRLPPEQLALQRQAFEIVEKLSTFERLVAIVEEDLGQLAEPAAVADFRNRPVSVSLAFGFADLHERLPRVTGHVSTRLPATCQRCLEACEIELAADVDLLLLSAEDAASVDEALEVWELEEERLRPLDIVEEMLVMALPLAARHEDPAECTGPASYENEEARETVRPFAGLKDKLGKSR